MKRRWKEGESGGRRKGVEMKEGGGGGRQSKRDRTRIDADKRRRPEGVEGAEGVEGTQGVAEGEWRGWREEEVEEKGRGRRVVGGLE